VSACQRSSRTTAASGLSTEPTPSEKPCGYGEAEATGAVEHHPASSTLRPGLQPIQQAGVAAACLASGGVHRNHLASGREFQHRLGVGLAHQGELFGAELQARRQQQGLQTGG